MLKLAIVTTHPIQYNSPVFRELAKVSDLTIKVFFSWGQSQEKVFDPKFKREIKWDIPVLNGFDYKFLLNTAKRPGSHHFFGIQNPTAIRDINLFNPDAILVYGWSFLSHLRIIHYFKGKLPIFFRGDSYLLDEVPGPKQLLRRLILRRVYLYIDFALYVGSNNRSYFLKHGLKEEQLIWVPHTIDNDRFSESSVAPSIARKKLKLPLEGLNLLFTGKFEEKKNPLLLLQAVKYINRNDVNLVFVGNGELEEELLQSAKGMKNVFFLPFQNQSTMPLIYSSADIVILPSSHNETWGLVINEAMACGKAVIVSDKVGCGTDLVKPDINGYIFKHDNLEDLAEKLENCLNNNRYIYFGAASKALIKDWSITKGVETMAEAIKKIT